MQQMTDMCNNTEPLKKAQKYLSTKIENWGRLLDTTIAK